MKLLYRVCQSWYMPWGKQCAKQTLYKGVTFGVNLSKFFKCTMKSACIYGISYCSARAFLCQREGSAKKRSGSPRMGDFLYKLLCLCRIFEIEDTRYGFREMLGSRRSEKPPNWSFNSTKMFLSLKCGCTDLQILSKQHKMRNCSALNKWLGRCIPKPFAVGPGQTSAQLLFALVLLLVAQWKFGVLNGTSLCLHMKHQRSP